MLSFSCERERFHSIMSCKNILKCGSIVICCFFGKPQFTHGKATLTSHFSSLIITSRWCVKSICMTRVDGLSRSVWFGWKCYMIYISETQLTILTYSDNMRSNVSPEICKLHGSYFQAIFIPYMRTNYKHFTILPCLV